MYYRVLVVDDERWIRKGIVKMIDAQGLGILDIYEADCVAMALELFERHRPDIILSDVMFPAENGCDFCEQVFSIKPETRIVIISAFDNFDFARRSIKFQAMDYLLKPVSKEQLNQVLKLCVAQLEKKHTDGSVKPEPVALGDITEDFGKNEKSSEEQIKAMMERIETKVAGKYTLSGMAAQCCLSEVYFSYLFKKVSGMSPMNYLVKVRMERACELMNSTNWRMVKIAQSVGYADYQYFTKVFKKKMGKTPGEYRRQMQKEFGDD